MRGGRLEPIPIIEEPLDESCGSKRHNVKMCTVQTQGTDIRESNLSTVFASKMAETYLNPKKKC